MLKKWISSYKTRDLIGTCIKCECLSVVSCRRRLIRPVKRGTHFRSTNNNSCLPPYSSCFHPPFSLVLSPLHPYPYSQSCFYFFSIFYHCTGNLSSCQKLTQGISFHISFSLELFRFYWWKNVFRVILIARNFSIKSKKIGKKFFFNAKLLKEFKNFHWK